MGDFPYNMGHIVDPGMRFNRRTGKSGRFFPFQPENSRAVPAEKLRAVSLVFSGSTWLDI